MPRESLLRFYVATLVLSCWATPALHLLTSRKPVRRLLCRLVDAFLDFLASTVVPVAIAAAYFQDIDLKSYEITPDQMFDTSWMIRAINDSPLVFFGSWVDAVSRLVFSIGLLSSLRVGRGMLTVKPRNVAPQSILPKKPHNPPLRRRQTLPHVVHIIHRAFVVYGVVVLAVHLHAELRVDPPSSCVMRVRPWFTRRPACAIIELSCFTNRSSSGSAVEIDGVLSVLDATSLEMVIVRHCTHVEMPPRLQNIKNLISFKAYNSTIRSWSDASALKQSSHRRMRFAYFVRTTFPDQSLPPGLTSVDFPRRLLDVQFSVTNLARLPSDLDARWPSGIALNLEFGQLTEFPLALTRARLQWISLGFNQISSLPREIFMAPAVAILSMNGNPIQELPENVDAASVHLRIFSLVSTRLCAVPTWLPLLPSARSRVFAGHTPICERATAAAQDQAALAVVDCASLADRRAVYPLELEARSDEGW